MEINKLKVGNFVRCGSAGIKQVKEIIKDKETLEPTAFIDEKGLTVDVKYIQNFNTNPLQLVELGDLINNEIVYPECFFDGVLYRDSNNPRQYERVVKFKKTDLKSFVTKEQLRSNEFIFDWN